MIVDIIDIIFIIRWSFLISYVCFIFSVFPLLSSVNKTIAKSNFETTNRFLVTVGIDFESPDDDDANQFNKAVINEIRNAISAGTFTRE